MPKLIKIESSVREALEKHMKARDDDMMLYGWVLKKHCPEVLDMTVREMLLQHSQLNVPSFESVRRSRCKLQAANENLRGTLYNERMNKQDEYLDFVRR